MSRTDALLVHLATLLVGGTGLVYGWMLYFAESSDPFSVVNHPWQPAVQHLHVWTAPLLVFVVGLIWRAHVWKHFRRGVQPRRRTGITLLLTAAPMVVSGYLLQTAVEPTWRSIWVGVHLTTSGLWLLSHLLHYLLPLLSKRRQEALQRAREAPAPTPSNPGTASNSPNASIV